MVSVAVTGGFMTVSATAASAEIAAQIRDEQSRLSCQAMISTHQVVQVEVTWKKGDQEASDERLSAEVSNGPCQ